MKSLIKFILFIAIFLFPVNSYGQIKVDFKKKVINQTNSAGLITLPIRLSARVLMPLKMELRMLLRAMTDNDQNKSRIRQINLLPTAMPQSDSGNETGKVQSRQEHRHRNNLALQTYSKYDFIPGEKIIFYEDFSQDAVGDFPALWNTNGSAEIVTTNLFPGNWMKFDCREAIWTDALLTLPDNYTIEFDIIPTKGSEGQYERLQLPAYAMH